MNAATLLLHIGHARNEVEVALTVIGVVLTLVGLGLAIWALWPRRRHGPTEFRSVGRAARRRALHEDDDGDSRTRPSTG